MALACGAECVVCLGCTRWAWRRCTYVGAYDSATWPPASSLDFEPVPRLCRLILSVYDSPPPPPSDPSLSPNPDWILRKASYPDTLGCCPPYLIYADHSRRELILALRGLHLAKESDYRILMDNSLGKQMFDGGFVHHGLLGAATWLLDAEGDFMRQKLEELGEGWKLIFVGHSLGSGVAALAALLVVNNPGAMAELTRENVRCYALAPARCMSLNLAVKYADIIHSVVLQDDFLPRTATPLEYIFGSVFCLPCLLFLICLRDTFIPESRKLRDPRRLYAPGRMYHIVERKFCRCGRFPPMVKSAIPVEGRFEHIVLSCNATSDHGILWIEREAHKALQMMKEQTEPTSAPSVQKMERMQTLQLEHKAALVKAVSMDIPHAVAVTDEITSTETPLEITAGDSTVTNKSNWNEIVEKMFRRSQSGNLKLKKETEILE